MNCGLVGIVPTTDYATIPLDPYQSHLMFFLCVLKGYSDVLHT